MTRSLSFLFLAAALIPSPTPAAASEGLRLQGERWSYGEGERQVTGILVKPAGAGPFPAVLISHGLGGSAGSFGMQKARLMAAWGFVCIAPDYTHAGGGPGAGGKGPGGKGPTGPADSRRSGPGGKGGGEKGAAKGQAPAEDFGASEENLRRALISLDILADLPEVDSERIAAYGHSMGGFVTIGLAAADPERLRAAAITASGVAPREGFPAPPLAVAAKIRTPFLILHGDVDTVVRPEQSASFAEALKTAGIDHNRVVYPGEGHSIDRTKEEEAFDAVQAWFARHGVE